MISAPLLLSTALMVSTTPCCSETPAVSGHVLRESVLLGMHFLHSSLDCNARSGGIEDVVPTFWDYTRHMSEDLEHFSYADFWHWWYEFERYKGDEKGLEEMDAIVDACLERGMKVKIDLSWSTWWAEDLDWETGPKLAYGPANLDDWVHLATLVGRRYRGRVAVWHPQGEANDLKGYWRGKPIEHVHEVYRLGARAFKLADPDVRVSVAGASPSVPREALDAWVESNVKALRGHFDDVPMNYFADIADPYHGLAPYYGSIRKILDENGARDAEVGSGESSFQWAESSHDIPRNPPRAIEGRDPAALPLCELKQAWRFEKSMEEFFGLGGNKFVLWGTEYAPAGGWTWRWGFRKYQDWWGTWPESHKVPGTNIVYRFDPPDGRAVDLRPGWSSRETDPFHPIWQVFKFWAQATPPGAEAVRMPARLKGAGAEIEPLCTYLRTRDSMVILLAGERPAGAELRFAVGRAGWEDGVSLRAVATGTSMDFATGSTKTTVLQDMQTAVENGMGTIGLPALSRLNTVQVWRDRGQRLDARPVQQKLIGSALPGETIEWLVTVRNTGSGEWPRGSVLLAREDTGAGPVFPILEPVSPGHTASLTIRLTAPEAEGRMAVPLRLRDTGGRWFGPLFFVSAQVTDPRIPRKLVAHRGAGQITVQWFAPEAALDVASYELFRADGRDGTPRSIARFPGNQRKHVDRDVAPGQAYYYHVVATGLDERRSRPSIVDNATVSSTARLFDAEVTSHSIPEELILGDLVAAKVTVKNTGTRPWDLAKLRLCWSATRLWGEQDERKLPRILLGTAGVIGPGESITIDVPMAAPRVGRFENHWILTLEPADKPRAYFGMPLLVESVVRESQ